MHKRQISAILRKLRLIYWADWIHYYVQRNKNHKSNNSFLKNNPDVKLPPDYLIYESFQIDYEKYFTESVNTAKWVKDYFSEHIELKDKKILDWGCGPGRVIRHLPNVIGNDCEYYGTDYNKQTINWCSKNLPGIHFNCNDLEAKLPYPDNFFDAIYGISIFTHLSEQMHYDWYNELYRIVKPNGIMLLTTQGDNFKEKLTDSELLRYNRNQLIIRDKVKEGHRMFAAFHPTAFMTKLFENIAILEHYVEPVPDDGNWIPQDTWVIKKRA